MEPTDLNRTEYATVPVLAKHLVIKHHALFRAANADLVPSCHPFGNRRLVKPAKVIEFIERTRAGGAA